MNEKELGRITSLSRSGGKPNGAPKRSADSKTRRIGSTFVSGVPGPVKGGVPSGAVARVSGACPECGKTLKDLPRHMQRVHA